VNAAEQHGEQESIYIALRVQFAAQPEQLRERISVKETTNRGRRLLGVAFLSPYVEIH
jgi:hypothetical protein